MIGDSYTNRPAHDGINTVEWPAPKNVKAFYTTRQGGISHKPYDNFNVGMHVGDNSEHVRQNRQQLLDSLPQLKRIAWLDQIHSNRVINADQTRENPPQVDASFTDQKHLACVVMTADCLPVLFCDRDGSQVAAAHAGWRGLLNGVLENTLQQFTAPNHTIMAWLGPAIGHEIFEVGAEVREAFINVSPNPADEAKAFRENPLKPLHYFADIYALARLRLQRAGVADIYGGGRCTFTEQHQFFSYRREPTTGRMCSLIYRCD